MHGPFDATKLQHSRVDLNDWQREVPIFLVAGEHDSLIPIRDMRELSVALPTPKRFAVLKGASHFHWFEDAEKLYNMCRNLWETGTLPGADIEQLRRNSLPFSDLCPNVNGLETLKALSLSQMDAHLKEDADARDFLNSGLAQRFAECGIGLAVEEEQMASGVKRAA
jgi:hypothetical protein